MPLQSSCIALILTRVFNTCSSDGPHRGVITGWSQWIMSWFDSWQAIGQTLTKVSIIICGCLCQARTTWLQKSPESLNLSDYRTSFPAYCMSWWHHCTYCAQTGCTNYKMAHLGGHDPLKSMLRAIESDTAAMIWFCAGIKERGIKSESDRVKSFWHHFVLTLPFAIAMSLTIRVSNFQLFQILNMLQNVWASGSGHVSELLILSLWRGKK